MDAYSSLMVFSLGTVTGIGFVAMMFAYFRAGPRRVPDFMMSTAMLMGGAAQYAGFAGIAEYSPAGATAAVGLFALANIFFWSAWAAHPTRPAGVFSGSVPLMLVSHGIYSVVRHPFYSAYIMLFAGMAVAGGLWWQYAIAAIAAILYNSAAHGEEKDLVADPHCGAIYAVYLRHSWRWIPYVW